MSRPTVVDIAREAGVSLATVDRVLNARPGVRPPTIARVQAAVARLGYVRDVAAANLARQRDYRLAFLLPDHPGEVQRTLRAAIADVALAAASDRTVVETATCRSGDPHALVAALEGLAARGIDGVAVNAPETPHVRDAIRALRGRGVAVAALISDLPNTARDRFVGVDNVAAGRTAGVLMGRFVGPRGGAVAVVAGSLLLRESVERRLGFDAVLAEQFKHVRALPSVEAWDDPERAAAALSRQFAATADLAGVYCMGAEAGAALDALRRLRRDGPAPVVVAHELTARTRAALAAGEADAVIAQDFGHIARSAVRVLRGLSGGAPIDPAQERIRIEIVIRENLPPEG